MTVEFDISDLTQLTAVFTAAPAKLARLIPKALEVTARKVKDDWRDDAKDQNSSHAKAYPRAVTYDLDKNTVFGVAVFRAEIGPEVGRAQGPLGFLEDANGGVRASPQRSGAKAVRKNEDDFEKGLLLAAEDALND